MKKFALTVLLATCLSLALLVEAKDWKLLWTEIQKIHAGDPSNLYATTVSTISDTGIDNSATGAFGTKNPALTEVLRVPVTSDTAMRGGTTGELLIAVVVQDFVNKGFLPQANGSIPTKLLPGGLEFKHKDFPNSFLTIHQLLTHTSGIVDNSRFESSPHKVSAGGTNVVSDLRTFGPAYFVTTGNDGKNVVQNDIWGNALKEPGKSGTFLYAKTNVALLTFMCQQVIADRPTMFTGPQSVSGWIQFFLLNPLGMTNTYFLLPDGSTPQVSGGVNQLLGGRVSDINAAGGVTSTMPIHACYTCDYMLITSAPDISKLMRALFIDTSSSIFPMGAQLKATLLVIPADPARPNIAQQGFGIVSFDVNGLCSSWLSRSGTTECPFSVTRPVWGFVASGTTASWCSMCTTSPETTTTNAAGVTSVVTTTSCTTAAQATRVSIATTSSNVQHVASGAFDQLYVDRSLTQGAAITEEDQTRSGFFGFLVFAGVFFSIFVVVLISYFIEYLVQPAPVAGSITADAYRKPNAPEYDD